MLLCATNKLNTLSVVMLNVIMLRVNILSVIMLNVVALIKYVSDFFDTKQAKLPNPFFNNQK
jgi:hypothetical protein